MMPKPTDSEKKICPKAAAHTDVLCQCRPVRREQRVEALGGTRQEQGTHHKHRERQDQQRDEDHGRRADPFCTPSAMMISTATHTTASGTSTPMTTDALTPGRLPAGSLRTGNSRVVTPGLVDGEERTATPTR